MESSVTSYGAKPDLEWPWPIRDDLEVHVVLTVQNAGVFFRQFVIASMSTISVRFFAIEAPSI